jgi:hypothetical protein
MPSQRGGGERNRIDLRVEPELRLRIERASVAMFGKPNLTGYIRAAIMMKLREDEAEMAQAPPRRRRKG